jgi:2'-5' RNA ligase
MGTLILTLVLDAASQARFQALRDAHFPPALNLVPAHVTLFHRLPGEERARIEAAIATLSALTPTLPIQVEGPRILGRGVALALRSPPLSALREKVRRSWADWLTPHDRQPWRPHVTVQNKVAPELARRLHQDLARDFAPLEAMAAGLRLWEYLGGPWRELRRFDFASGVPASRERG